MNLKQILFKKAYSSDSDDILHDFYIPALEASIGYRRLAGFFSSASLAIAARGVLGLIKNGGMIKLIVSPRLQKNDVEIIINSYLEPEKYIERKMLDELEKLENEFVRDHIYALGWMIANKKIEFKVAVAYDDEGNPLSLERIQQIGLFHQKVGILEDADGNIITFSGSVNETALGWLGNVEEFKVFRNWENIETDYVKADILKFDRFWNNQVKRLRVINLPRAVEEKLVKLAPVDIDKIDLNKWRKPEKKIKLFHYQEEAIESWLTNGKKGIFEMATGTGKTFTALGCLEKLLKNNQKIAIILTAPYQHLVQQWKREIEKFGFKFENIIADSTRPSWKNELSDYLSDVTLGYKDKITVLTTHDTFSSEDFLKIIKENKKDFNIFLIADEVHGLGAQKRKTGLIDDYDFRLGLSATPRRWFDIAGTEAIYNYFGGVVFEFGLKDAVITINPATNLTYLTPYHYIPRFISLNSDELQEYIDTTKSITYSLCRIKNENESEEFLSRLLFKRANIIKNAESKYQDLEILLDTLGANVKWAIIYCTPQQIDRVMQILKERKIIAHRFTMDQKTKPEMKYNGLSEREFILKKFAEGDYQILVAMKCLDEGVDIPQARIAIIMASSGNPREYIQRIGRIIRRYPEKSSAGIYDMVVFPSFTGLPKELKAIEANIFKKELERYEEIAKIAVNNAEALRIIYQIKNKLGI